MAEAVGDPGSGAVITVEGGTEVSEELGAIGLNLGAESVEDFHRQARGVLVRLQHDGRHRTDEHGACDSAFAVLGDVAGDLAAAGGMAYVNRVREIEVVDEFSEIGGVGVEVVAVECLAGTAVATTVMGDDTVAVVGQEDHLVFEGVG